MSMIDCKVNIEKKPDPKGDRVVLSFEYVSRFSQISRETYTDGLVVNSYLMPNGEVSK